MFNLKNSLTLRLLGGLTLTGALASTAHAQAPKQTAIDKAIHDMNAERDRNSKLYESTVMNDKERYQLYILINDTAKATHLSDFDCGSGAQPCSDLLIKHLIARDALAGDATQAEHDRLAIRDLIAGEAKILSVPLDFLNPRS